MVLISTHQDKVGMEISAQTAWDTLTTPTWLRLPLISETLTIDPQPVDDPEIGDAGFRESAEIAREAVRGVITVAPYYDLPAIFIMLGNAFGGMEGYKDNVQMRSNNAGAPTLFSGTHYWVPQSYAATAAGSASAIPPGIAARIWRSGENTSGHVYKYTNLMPTGFTWEQTQGASPRLSFPVIGSKPTIVLASGETALSAMPAGLNRVKWEHLNAGSGGAQGAMLYGTSLGNFLYPTRFSVTLDGSWVIPESLATLGTVDQPRHEGRWIVSGEVEFPQQQIGPTTEFPTYRYFNNVAAKMVFRYNGQLIEGTLRQGWELRMNGVRWTSLEPGIQGGVVLVRGRFEAEMALVANADVATEDDYTVPIMVQTHGLAAVDSSTKYLGATSGGNDVPVGELRVDNA